MRRQGSFSVRYSVKPVTFEKHIQINGRVGGGVHVHECVCIHQACMSTCAYMRMCVCVCVHACACVCIHYVCMRICACVCVGVCVCVCGDMCTRVCV